VHSPHETPGPLDGAPLAHDACAARRARRGLDGSLARSPRLTPAPRAAQAEQNGVSFQRRVLGIPLSALQLDATSTRCWRQRSARCLMHARPTRPFALERQMAAADARRILRAHSAALGRAARMPALARAELACLQPAPDTAACGAQAGGGVVRGTANCGSRCAALSHTARALATGCEKSVPRRRFLGCRPGLTHAPCLTPQGIVWHAACSQCACSPKGRRWHRMAMGLRGAARLQIRAAPGRNDHAEEPGPVRWLWAARAHQSARGDAALTADGRLKGAAGGAGRHGCARVAARDARGGLTTVRHTAGSKDSAGGQRRGRVTR